MFKSEQHMAAVRLLIRDNPLVAFAENINAYQVFPYNVETRRQLSGAMLALISTGRAQIDPEAADIVWAISETVSPYDVSGLIGRASYLVNFGRTGEIEAIAARLKKVAPLHIETWIVEGYAALRAGDKPRLKTALDMAAKSDREDKPALAALAEQLRSLE